MTEIVQAFQRILMYLSLAALAALFVGSVLYKTRAFWDDLYHRWLHLDTFGRWGAVAAVAMMTLYGGSKNAGVIDKTDNTGSDDGIGIVFVHLEPTNVVTTVDSAVTTSLYTMVSIGWTNGTVTTSTPFSARNSREDNWTTLEKLNPTTFTDVANGGTNMLFFTVSGSISGWGMYWLGSDPPAVIVSSDGIVLTQFEVTSTSVTVGWTCDDENCQTYAVRRRKITNGVAGAWQTMATDIERDSSGTNTWIFSGFSVDNTYEYQIRGEYYED